MKTKETAKYIEYRVSYVIIQNNKKDGFTKTFSVYSEAISYIDDLIENEDILKITLEESIRKKLECWKRSDDFDGEMVEVEV